MPSKEEVIEAAMLARMVGSHLQGVDQLTVERSNNAANKINMQNFVAPLLGRQAQNTNMYSDAPPDMVKAYQGLNELALQSVPDPIGSHTPIEAQLPIQAPIATPNYIPISNVPVVAAPNKTVNTDVLTRSDVDSIRNSLKGIDKSLAAMVKLLNNSKLVKHD
jgi:hypothetical protein